PEIVVTKLQTARSSGTPDLLAPMRFAYGHAIWYYNPLLTRWSFAGYERRVSMFGETEGSAVVSLAYAKSTLSGIAPYALMGRTQINHQFKGTLLKEPGSYLGLNYFGLIGQNLEQAGYTGYVATKWDFKEVSQSTDPTADATECSDYDPHSGTTGDAKLCRR